MPLYLIQIRVLAIAFDKKSSIHAIVFDGTVLYVTVFYATIFCAAGAGGWCRAALCETI